MNTTWERRRLLVVVAHPDDETFGCGSVIADAAAGGAHVTVCCATRGEAGELRSGCDLAGRTLAEQRVRELHDAGSALGAGEIIVLDFQDSGMDGDASATTLFGAPFETLVDAVARVVEQVAPDVVVTLDVSGGDGHRDHARIGAATTEAVQRVASGASLYYYCLVRSLLVRWVEALRARHPDSQHLDLDTSTLGRPDEDVTTIVDVSRLLGLRRRAIALHASQRSPYEDMSDELADAFLRTDRLVRVRPPWLGGAPESRLHLPAPGHESRA
jgi:LmbE family N-acetylglucosaminyl deacetylase